MKLSTIVMVAFFLSLLTPASAQSDSRVEGILVTNILETRGFTIHRDLDIDLSRDETSPLFIRRLWWQGRELDGVQYDELEVELFYGYFDDPTKVVDALDAITDLFRTGVPIQHEVDVDGIRDLHNMAVFVKDHFVVAYVVRGRATEQLTDKNLPLFSLASELKTALIQNINAANQPKIPSFNVEFHRDNSSPDFVVNAQLTGGIGPFYRWQVNRETAEGGYEVVLEQEAIRLSDDTRNIQVSPSIESLPPGSYTFHLVVGDRLERGDIYSEEIVVGVLSHIETLSSYKDVFLKIRDPHQNEGANPLLTLEKIQGKATRSAVAFELADTNLNGLSRATLVLTIDPSQAVNGWGNGRTISAQAITTPWQEGNGWSFGLKKKDQIAGNGSGATWFSPADQDISNDSANSAVNWDGATSSVYPPTAPSVQIANFQSGEVAFDVTTDVLNGAENGWLVLKDQENVGSKVSFYSREGAAAAGNPDLAPRLILEFGDPVASAAPSNGLLAEIGFGSIGTKFRTTRNGSELRSVREILQDSPVAALAAEQMLCEAARTNPVLNLTARTAYRSWLAEDLQVATVPRWAV